MNESVEWYAERARALTHPDGFSALRQAGLAAFEQAGWPTRAIEAWKYTPADFMQSARFMPACGSETEPDVLPSWCNDGICLQFVNGRLQPIDESLLPAGVKVMTLKDALHADNLPVTDYLGRIMQPASGFEAYNAAMLNAGVCIYLAPFVRLEKPLILCHWQDRGFEAVYLRHLVIASPGSDATVVEYYASDSVEACHTNAVSELALEADARLAHYTLRADGTHTRHVGHTFARVMRGARFESHTFGLGGKLVRRDVDIRLEGEGASCLQNGVFMPREGEHIDHHTRVEHQVGGCESVQDYRGVLNGKCRGVFNGRVVVAKGADRTRALQNNRNLLLSTDAEIDTLPQLEIFADDVSCSHGATVGQLDRDALFYLQARGLSLEDARALLVRGFVTENLRNTHPLLRTWLSTQLTGGEV